jgi:hypothetical protein
MGCARDFSPDNQANGHKNCLEEFMARFLSSIIEVGDLVHSCVPGYGEEWLLVTSTDFHYPDPHNTDHKYYQLWSLTRNDLRYIYHDAFVDGKTCRLFRNGVEYVEKNHHGRGSQKQQG